MIHAGYPKPIVDVAVKGLRHLMQLVKDDEQLTDQVADIVWRILPDILSSHQSDAGSLKLPRKIIMINNSKLYY